MGRDTPEEHTFAAQPRLPDFVFEDGHDDADPQQPREPRGEREGQQG